MDLGGLLRRAHAESLALAPETGLGGRHPSEFAVLTVVAAGPGSQRALGDRIAIDRTTMVQLLDRLEAEGLVARERDPNDRRNYNVALTPQGRRTYGRLEKAIAAHTQRLTRGLSAAERRRLHELLLDLVQIADLPAPMAERTGFLVARASFGVQWAARERLAPLGVDPQDVALLGLLADRGSLSQRAVADELGVSGTIVVRLADRLEAEGLLERARDPDDRRVHRLTPTAEGRELLPKARRAIADATASYTRPIGREGRDELIRLLAALAG